MSLKDVELRKLPAGSLYGIATILETNNVWKKVMSLIPRNPQSEDFVQKYNNEHIKQIEDHARATNRKCAEILFEEWGSSGRIRPTLKTLQAVVQKAEILRAADDIAELLGEAPAKRPTDGPGAPVPLNITEMLKNDMTTASLWKSYGVTNDQPIGNRITLQMKSEGQPVTYTLSSQDIPNIPAFKGIGDKTSIKMRSENDLRECSAFKSSDKTSGKMKSVNDLREYTNELIENYQSKFLPDFSNIMGDTIDTDKKAKEAEKNKKKEEFPKIEIHLEILNNSELVKFPYAELERITNDFNEKVVFLEDPPNSKMAGKIGSGGFADVYVGHYGNYGHVAVKKPKPKRDYKKKPEILNRIFNYEILFLSRFKHTNIVSIIGYSIDGSSPCIVCEYIEGGTLEKKLEEKTLTEKQRINIMIGVAEALKFLHSDHTANITRSILSETGSKSKKSFVHGDVKTANILLTKDNVPKLCDFAAGKQYDVTSLVSHLMYTPAYLAPEQLQGTITQETDIYHYGRILLELLTGYKSVISVTSGCMNLKMYLEEKCQKNEITNCLDPFIDRWTKATEIYSLAKSCLQDERKLRPSAVEICETLNKMGWE